jgi:hypothetical protein
MCEWVQATSSKPADGGVEQGTPHKLGRFGLGVGVVVTIIRNRRNGSHKSHVLLTVVGDKASGTPRIDNDLLGRLLMGPTSRLSGVAKCQRLVGVGVIALSHFPHLFGCMLADLALGFGIGELAQACRRNE